MPVARRGVSGASLSSATSSSLRPAPAPSPLGVASRGISSTMLFQPPQASQRPAHLPYVAPHC